MYLFFESDLDIKKKRLIMFWTFFVVLPSALTLNGGSHAARLILILPVLINILISFGWEIYLYKIINGKYKSIFTVLVICAI